MKKDKIQSTNLQLESINIFKNSKLTDIGIGSKLLQKILILNYLISELLKQVKSGKTTFQLPIASIILFYADHFLSSASFKSDIKPCKQNKVCVFMQKIPRISFVKRHLSLNKHLSEDISPKLAVETTSFSTLGSFYIPFICRYFLLSEFSIIGYQWSISFSFSPNFTIAKQLIPRKKNKENLSLL